MRILYFLLIFTLPGCGTLARYKEIKPLMVEGKVEGLKMEKPCSSFRVGEKLKFSVYWFKIPVGTVETEVEESLNLEGKELYHITAIIRSNKYLRPIFWVEDKIQTWIDKETLTPIKFVKNRREGRYRCNAVLSYDQENHKLYFKNFTDRTEKTIDIPERVQDLLSAFYYFRTLDIKPDRGVSIFVNQDEKNWEVSLKIESMGEMNLPNVGVFDAFMVEPSLQLEGEIYEKGRGWIWFSADKKRIPLMLKIKANIPIIGTIVAVLEKLE